MATILNDDNFETDVLKNEGVVLVDFWAEWCGPCQQMLPTLEDFSKEMEGKMTIGKVNVDDYPSIAQGFRVMSIPTLIIFKNGKPVDQMVGVKTKEELTELTAKYL